MDLDEAGLLINAEVFRTIWMRGVQLGAELMIMTLNLDEYEGCNYADRH